MTLIQPLFMLRSRGELSGKNNNNSDDDLRHMRGFRSPRGNGTPDELI